jgi:hypothetical protein
VITAQNAALSNQVTAVNILGRRLASTVLLIQALGGGWNASSLSSLAADPGAANPGATNRTTGARSLSAAQSAGGPRR